MSEIKATQPPLFDRLKAGLEEAEEWMKGNIQSRATIVTADGTRIGPEMMTRQEFEARRADIEAGSHLAYDAGQDALRIALNEGEIVSKCEIEPGLVVGYDAQGDVVSVEVRNASRRIARPEEAAA